MTEIIRHTAEYYMQLVKDNKPFSFARFGDGEVLCMFNTKFYANCDMSRFLPSVKYPMLEIFSNNYGYYHCLLDCTLNYHYDSKGKIIDASADKFKEYIQKYCPDMLFYDGEVWQEMSFSGRIEELMNVFTSIPAVMVGNSLSQNVIKIKGVSEDIVNIKVPDRDAILKVDDIMRDILYQYAIGKRMFLFSAGYATKIMIDSLFPHIGSKCFMIDLGSVLDPYCGKLSRTNMVIKGKEYFNQYLKA